MNTSDACFSRFCLLLLRGEVLSDPFLGFRELCRLLSLPPRPLERRLRAEFGLGGEALMEVLRQSRVQKNAKNDGLAGRIVAIGKKNPYFCTLIPFGE